jgi:hypothetical protein
LFGLAVGHGGRRCDGDGDGDQNVEPKRDAVRNAIFYPPRVIGHHAAGAALCYSGKQKAPHRVRSMPVLPVIRRPTARPAYSNPTRTSRCSRLARILSSISFRVLSSCFFSAVCALCSNGWSGSSSPSAACETEPPKSGLSPSSNSGPSLSLIFDAAEKTGRRPPRAHTQCTQRTPIPSLAPRKERKSSPFSVPFPKEEIGTSARANSLGYLFFSPFRSTKRNHFFLELWTP